MPGALSRPPVVARRLASLWGAGKPRLSSFDARERFMSDLAKLPVTIVTGFLGAGKTTLISHLIRNAGGRRLAVVVNEFGTLGVDGDILKSCAIPDCPAENIVELANGCICCTVADDFIPTVEALLALEPRPDHILIETSGLALPKPLLKAFDWPAIRSRITVDGVIALADAEAVADGRFAPDLEALEAQRLADPGIDHETPLSEVFEDQLACADMVLLTKADLAGPEGIAAARAVIAAETPRPLPVIELVDGVIDPRVLLGLNAAAEDDLAARPSHHDGEDDHEHEDFDSVVLTLGEIADPADLTARIERLAREQQILRVKGYAAVAGKPMRLLVQAVGARVRHQYDRPWRPGEARATALVVIAEHDRIDEAAIRAVLEG
jgi:cobalamin biosynthesis protein CobW